jgi:hypothetical protein
LPVSLAALSDAIGVPQVGIPEALEIFVESALSSTLAIAREGLRSRRRVETGIASLRLGSARGPLAPLPWASATLSGAFAPVCSRRVLAPVNRLSVGAILAPGTRPITAVVRGMGRGDEAHVQTDHRVLHRARRRPLDAGPRLRGVRRDACGPAGPGVITRRRRRHQPCGPGTRW